MSERGRKMRRRKKSSLSGETQHQGQTREVNNEVTEEFGGWKTDRGGTRGGLVQHEDPDSMSAKNKPSGGIWSNKNPPFRKKCKDGVSNPLGSQVKKTHWSKG